MGVDVLGILATRSEQFRLRWAGHDVRCYRSGTQAFHHPFVGDLTLDYDALEIPAEPGQTIIAYGAQPDSAAHRALEQLARWTSTPNDATAITSDRPI